MLKKVCLLLQNKIREEKEDLFDGLFQNLREHQVEILLLEEPSLGDAKRFADLLINVLAATEDELAKISSENTDAENILYITDSFLVYQLCKQAQLYVLPYVHDYNRNIKFPGASYVIEQLEEMDYEACDMAYRRIAGLPWDILETERCVVRETTVADVDAFYDLYKEPSITEYMEDLFAVKEEEIAYVQDYIKNVYFFYGYGMWTITEKSTGEVIGRAGISWREGYDIPEMGFMIGVPWQRQGYAYEVCEAILRYAKEELQMDRVQAFVQVGNVKSMNLCEKLKFRLTDTVKLDEEYHIYLYSDAWK